jgi:glycosidase
MGQKYSLIDWAANTNIYEVNLRQYTREGTITSFLEHLPRLKEMGIKTLWFMPLHPIGRINRKGTLGSAYSISDHTMLNPDYGEPDDFKKLVITAHEMDMKVVIDWVANHTAWDHVWTNSHPSFFSKDEEGNFCPPYPDWSDVIHLDYGNKKLWYEMTAAMQYWVDNFDIDGFRCDMAHLVPIEFWKHARTELDKVKKLFWLAETEDPAYHEAFDASYTWEFLHAAESYWRKETGIFGLDNVLYEYEKKFPADALRLFFTSNHDENSHSGSEYERLGDAAKLFAVFSILWKGIPLIYSGQEIPVKRRILFFDKDPIDWSAKPLLHDFYKKLLSVRTVNPAMKGELFRIATTDGGHILSFMHKNGDNEILVLLNLSPEKTSFVITDERVSETYADIFNEIEMVISDAVKFKMEPWGFLVLEK